MYVLRNETEAAAGRDAKFFLIGLSHNDLMNYYNTNFQLMQHHKYSLSEIDSLIPWEKDVYVEMLIHHIKQEQEAQQRNTMA